MPFFYKAVCKCGEYREGFSSREDADNYAASEMSLLNSKKLNAKDSPLYNDPADHGYEIVEYSAKPKAV